MGGEDRVVKVSYVGGGRDLPPLSRHSLCRVCLLVHMKSFTYSTDLAMLRLFVGYGLESRGVPQPLAAQNCIAPVPSPRPTPPLDGLQP